MKEWIKYTEDEAGENACLECHASADTVMWVVARLILNIAKGTKGELSVNKLMDELEHKYIPRGIIAMGSDKTVYEEVIDPE